MPNFDAKTEQLLAAILVGTANPDQQRAFNTLLATDDALLDEYLRLMRTDAALHFHCGHVTTPAFPTPAAVPSGTTDSNASPLSPAGAPIYRKGHEPKPTRIRPVYYAITAIAAALLIVCGIAVYLFTLNPEPSPQNPPEPSTAPLATLIEATEGAQLTTPGGFISEGRDYGRGEYTLSGGSAEFMLTNAVNVKLRGNTRLYMRNNMNVALTRGSAEFIVPKDATGFTVHLPDDSKIVDLGTAFSVKLDDEGEAQLRVRKGSVKWTPAGVDAEPLLIVAGQSARIVDGQRIVTFEPIEIAIANTGFEEATGDAGKGNFTNVTDWNEQSEVDVFVFKGGREWQPEADGVLYLNSTRGAVHQDVNHHWSPDDAYTIELVAFEAGFRVGTVGDAVRVQLRQTDGTVLWDSGPVNLDDTLTGLPGNFAYTGSDHRHSWDIDASAFSSIADAVEGSGLNLRIAGSGGAVFVDDVALSVAIGGDAAPPESPQAPEAVDTPETTDLPQHTTEPIETSVDNVSATSNEED